MARLISQRPVAAPSTPALRPSRELHPHGRTASWINCTGDQRCSPAAIERPASRPEVAAAIERAAEAGRPVRVAGSGHSFNDGVLTDGTLLSLERMNRLVAVDRASGLVRVEAGITLRELSEVLDEHGLAFRNLGDVDAQTIAGATATGTHGTGIDFPNLSAGLESVELVLADGSTLECSEAGDGDAWRSARIGVGALGVVTAVTLKAVPAFTLEAVETTTPIEQILDELDARVEANDHFEFFTFPHSRLALTKTSNRVNEAPRPSSPLRAFLRDIVLKNYAYWAVCIAGRTSPRLSPALNRLTSLASGSRRRVDRSDRIYTTPRRVPLTELEYAIPREHAADAVREVRAIAERPEFAAPTPIEARFVAPDDAFLSPTGGGEACYITVFQFRGLDREAYFRAVEELMVGLGGRPHWGKRHAQTAETLRPRYPEWDRFQAVRARLDPDGLFMNAYVERVLGAPLSVATAR